MVTSTGNTTSHFVRLITIVTALVPFDSRSVLSVVLSFAFVELRFCGFLLYRVAVCI
jgi:hypothetical protein